MVWIWFGLDGTGIQKSPDFHWLLGPVLMVLFSVLGNTLFLTILVSMLSNTFSLIATNATAEIQFRRAVLTFEGVKSDAIFAYMPPSNILALLFVLPLKLVLSERIFHKANVYATRTLNAPLLLLISLYERHYLWLSDRHRHRPPAPKALGPCCGAGRHLKTTVAEWARRIAFWDFSYFSVHGNLHAVFEVEPPHNVIVEIAEEDEEDGGEPEAIHGRALHAALDEQFSAISSPRRSPHRAAAAKRAAPRPRRRSSAHERLAATFVAGSPSERGLSTSRERMVTKMKRKKRMDSIADLASEGSAMDEANERLQRLEEGLSRIEDMLSRFVGEEEGDKEDDDVPPELNQELQTGIHE